MPCVPLRLEAAGLDPLDLASGAFHMVTFDPGYPVVREQVEQAPDADGTIDTTQFFGARNVTLGVSISPTVTGETRWQLTQRLKAFLSPRLRPQIYVQYSTLDPELMMTLRPAILSDQLSPQTVRRFDVVAQWVCPSGIMEAAELSTETITPGGDTTAGLEFDPTLDEFDGVEFPLVAPPGTAEIVNSGDRDAYPVIRLFGPFGDEGNPVDETTIENITTGRALVLAGTAIAAGDYLEIDFRSKTILVNSLSSQSRYNRLVFPDSKWWTLTPGRNEIAFRPDTFSGNAQAIVRWRSAYS